MPDDPPAGYVSSADACRRLGISDRTLRRRVQAGTLSGEYVARPQGSILYVRLPPDHAADHAAEQAAEQAAPDPAPASAPGRPDAPGGADTALAARLLDTLEVTQAALQTAQAALLAATDRAARAEAERDGLQLAADELRRRVAGLERDARRSWLDRLLGRRPVDGGQEAGVP